MVLMHTSVFVPVFHFVLVLLALGARGVLLDPCLSIRLRRPVCPPVAVVGLVHTRPYPDPRTQSQANPNGSTAKDELTPPRSQGAGTHFLPTWPAIARSTAATLDRAP